MPIVEAIAAIGPALATAKQLKQIDAEFDKSELKAKVTELSDALFEARDALREASGRIGELEEQAKVAQEMEWRQPSYWRVNAEAGEDDGPFCQVCWDSDRKAIRQQGRPDFFLSCGVCKTKVSGPDYRRRGRPTVVTSSGRTIRT